MAILRVNYLFNFIAIFLLSLSLSSPLFAQDSANQNEHASTKLNIGVLYSTTGQRGFLQELAMKFQAENPDIVLHFNGYTDSRYKQLAPKWLSSEGQIDVMYWQGGLRLLDYIKQGKIHAINDVWNEHNLAGLFPQSIVDVVKADGNVYGVPYAYYSWGMLYNKSLLNRLALKAPETWPELVELCHKADQMGVFPIALGGLEPWLPAAWFDYINLRVNGLAFHLKLLRGEASYLDYRVKVVFQYWKELVDANCFNSRYTEFNWRDIMTSMYRKMSVSTLTASFVDVQIPERFHADFEFRPFPIVKTELPVYEDMPVDLFLIPEVSKNKTAAKKFLIFLSRADVQHMIVDQMSQSSPNVKASQSTGLFSAQNREILRKAEGVAQFFDRDMPQTMVNESLSIIGRFTREPDVLKTQQALENVRLKYLKSMQIGAK